MKADFISIRTALILRATFFGEQTVVGACNELAAAEGEPPDVDTIGVTMRRMRLNGLLTSRIEHERLIYARMHYKCSEKGRLAAIRFARACTGLCELVECEGERT